MIGLRVTGHGKRKMSEPVYIMLVGLPGVGKTTFRETVLNTDYTVFSSDLYLEKFAKELGKTYNDVFSEYYIESVELAEDTLDIALDQGYDIIDDHPNLSIKARKRRLRFIPDHYTKVALVFNPPPEDEYRRRLANRPGKIIPEPVIKSMYAAFEMPTVDEGFDYVAVIQ